MGIAASAAPAALISYTNFTPITTLHSGDLVEGGITATLTSTTGAGTFTGTATYLGHSSSQSQYFDSGTTVASREGFTAVFDQAVTLKTLVFTDGTLESTEQFSLAIGGGTTQTFAGAVLVSGLFDVGANYIGDNVLGAGQAMTFIAMPTTAQTVTSSRFRLNGITIDNVVPEPASLGLCLVGLGMMSLRRRRANR
ncbi:MAG: PEP-CTERM sorting domain-containing protein [Phycisphaeraceae bacterium]